MIVSYPVALGFFAAIPHIVDELALLQHTVADVTVHDSSALQKVVKIELKRILSHEELIQLGAYIGSVEARFRA